MFIFFIQNSPLELFLGFFEKENEFRVYCISPSFGM
jgi:hypothetical protein